jgi:hypothetical protein
VCGGMYRGQPLEGDLEKCQKQKEIMDLSDLATGVYLVSSTVSILRSTTWNPLLVLLFRPNIYLKTPKNSLIW